MAEAVVDQRPNRFYCHQCSLEIKPNLPEYTCPQCESGFIEELTEAAPVTPDPQENAPQVHDPVSQFAELWGRTFLEDFEQHAGNRPSSTQPDNRTDPPTRSEQVPSATSGPSPQEDVLPPPPMPWPHHTRISIHSRVPGERHATSLQGLIEELLRGFGTGAVLFHGQGGRSMPFPFGPVFNLHGNPADYAWGAGGLDNIITQLLNQLEGTGPPPAAKEEIDSLPTVNITQEQIDKTLQCSVCMDDFTLNETVNKLPCNHHFHEACIKQWLELHGTCPVCRKTLDGKETKTDENTVLSDMERAAEGATNDESRHNQEPSDNLDLYDVDNFD